MNCSRRLVYSLGLGVLGGLLLVAAPARAEDEAPADPTRGQWDSGLDPLREAEDHIVDAQKWLEDRSKIHLAFGVMKSIQFDFNDPKSNVITLHSLDPDHLSDNLDIAQLAASRPSDGFIPGFGVKLNVGRIAHRTKSDWDGDGTLSRGDEFEHSDFDVEEAYLTWAIPEGQPVAGLSVKAGKFVTPLGAEVIEPWNNYNFSRSFMFGYAIPFTHTGALLTYPLTDKLSVTGGAVTGWDEVTDANRGWTGLGNVTYVVSDQVTLAGNGIWGPEQVSNTGSKRGVADIVATIKPVDKFTLLLNYDWGHEENVIGGESALWQGFAAVANYDLTDRWSTALRGEWFEDHNGSRTGLRQTLWEATATAKYLITQHLSGRLEYRHDESSQDHVFLAGNTKLTPGQDLLAVAFTYLFN
jgi:hypothetical protein